MYKPNYVCVYCSQTFTRKPSGERHIKNNNLDSAALVRFMDYLVGRATGKYMQGDPLLHRRRNKNIEKKSLSAESAKKVSDTGFTVMPDKTIKEHSQNIMKASSDNRKDQSSYDDLLVQFNERTRKFREFVDLVRKFYSNYDAEGLIGYAKTLEGQAFDDWIDSILAKLRSIDKQKGASGQC